MPAKIPLLLIAIVSLCGCSSLGLGSGTTMQPIVGKPPASAVVLAKPVTVSAMSGEVTFPAGKYHAVYQDDHGYFFEAPTKVLVDLVATYGYEGGLYLARDTMKPTHWYVMGPEGRPTTGRFKVVPKFSLEP